MAILTYLRTKINSWELRMRVSMMLRQQEIAKTSNGMCVEGGKLLL